LASHYIIYTYINEQILVSSLKCKNERYLLNIIRNDYDDKELKHKWLAKEVPCRGDKSRTSGSLFLSLSSLNAQKSSFSTKGGITLPQREWLLPTLPPHMKITKNESVNYGGLKIEEPQHK